MIAMPEFVTCEIVVRASEIAREKKPGAPIHDVRMEALNQGESVQIMHIGPYADEGPTVARLHAYIEANGWSLSGVHHEIYLSDPRKVSADRMKTIIRQPFERP